MQTGWQLLGRSPGKKRYRHAWLDAARRVGWHQGTTLKGTQMNSEPQCAHQSDGDYYESGSESLGLVWWRPYSADHPFAQEGQFWRTPPEGWLNLRHECDGYRINYLYGWAKVVTPSSTALGLLDAIASEDFAKGCNPSDLGYGAEDVHRKAYSAFLASHGLDAGDLSRLMNAVYPLAATTSNLRALGVESSEVPSGALLLVLGWNCD